MVQIIPAAKTFGSQFGAALGGGISEGIEERFKKQTELKKTKLENEQIKKTLGLDLAGISDPNIRKELLSKELQKGVETHKQDLKTKNLAEALKGLGLSSTETRDNDLVNQERREEPTAKKSSKKPPRLIPEEKLLQLAATSPELARELRAQQDSLQKAYQHENTIESRENLAKERQDFEKRENLRKETLPIRQEYAKKAQAAQQGIENKEQLLELIEKGNIDDPTYAALSEALPLNLGKRLLSDDTVAYKAGIVDEFRDLKNIFQGQVRVKEIEILEEKVADLYLTDSQKKAVLNSRLRALKADVIRAEAAAEVEEMEDVGALNFTREVEKKAKPQLDALFNQILDEQKAIIQDAENRKKIPLDFNDPEDKKIAESILLEAGGNRNKARELAKKKGYTF